MTADIAQRLQLACIQEGLRCGVWESLPDYGSMLRRAGEGFDFIVEQIEGDGQYDRVLQSVGPFRDLYPDMPAAIITNFGGVHTQALAAPLISAGLGCLTECFVAENPMSTPERQVDYATRVLGWPSAQPMLGLGGGLTLDAYPTGKSFAGWSCWAAEFIYP